MTDKFLWDWIRDDGTRFISWIDTVLPEPPSNFSVTYTPIPDDAEGDDNRTFSADELDALRKEMQPDLFRRLYPEPAQPDPDAESTFNHYRQQQEAEERIAQIARNVYASMQKNARDNIELSHVLHAIDRACDMVRHTRMSKISAVNAIWPQVVGFTNTVVWREFKRAVEGVAGFEHHPKALLTDLIQAGLDDYDEL